MSLKPGEPIDESLRQLFIAETNEQLEKFIEILLKLEKNPNNQSDVIHKLFRLAHNVKGSAGMMGLGVLKDIMHQTENMMDMVRNGQVALNAERIDLLLQFSDVVKNYVLEEQWDNTKQLEPWLEVFNCTQTDTNKIEEKTEIALYLSEQEKKGIAAWQEEGKTVYGIDIQFDSGAQMQGASALIFVKFVEELGVIFKTAPEINALKNGNFIIFKLVLFTEKPLTEEQEVKITTYPLYEAINIIPRKWIYRPDEGSTPLKIDRQYEQTIRVDAQKIDKLVNDVGELLVVKSGFSQLFQQGYPDKQRWDRFTKEYQKFEQVVGIIQRGVMDLRMIPVRQLFYRFPKIVRDIAKQKGKMVELGFFGEDTEIDKQIAERVADPLTHIIRNAVDHGLEDRETRLQFGKTDYGRITLGASQEGDSIIITISDDGQGLNLERIKAKALKNNLIKQDDILTDDEVIKLIFQPGFSTAEQVSDISGRGVGLDVVQHSIKDLKGDIEIETNLNQGTTFRLKVPLTLAVVQSFLVKIGGQIFGFPAGDVIESMTVNPDHFHRFADKLLFTLRDEAISIIDLHQYFQFDKPENMDRTPLIVVKYGRTKAGLIVEELMGQEEIIVKQINRAMSENPLISGAALLGSGDIALIINIHELIRREVR